MGKRSGGGFLLVGQRLWMGGKDEETGLVGATKLEMKFAAHSIYYLH